MFLMFIGFVASVTSIFSLVPQIYHTYKLKSVKDLSLLMLINFLICSLSWIIYGYLTHTFSVIITNIIMVVCSVILIVFKIKYSPKTKFYG